MSLPTPDGGARTAIAVAILGNDALLAASPATPVQLAHACHALGFDYVFPASWGDELVAREATRQLAARGPGTAILCACPHVTARLLAAGEELAPFCVATVAPPVAAARYARLLFPEREVRITYVGACPSVGDGSIDERLHPDVLLDRFAGRRIAVAEQPRVFESVVPPDRRRWASLPGGAPTEERLRAEGGGRALVEIEGDDLAAEIAQLLIAGEHALLDPAPRVGCACSGAVAGVPSRMARANVASLEPPRATSPVVEGDVPVELDLRRAIQDLARRRTSAAPAPVEEAPAAVSGTAPQAALGAVPELELVDLDFVGPEEQALEEQRLYAQGLAESRAEALAEAEAQAEARVGALAEARQEADESASRAIEPVELEVAAPAETITATPEPTPEPTAEEVEEPLASATPVADAPIADAPRVESLADAPIAEPEPVDEVALPADAPPAPPAAPLAQASHRRTPSTPVARFHSGVFPKARSYDSGAALPRAYVARRRPAGRPESGEHEAITPAIAQASAPAAAPDAERDIARSVEPDLPASPRAAAPLPTLPLPSRRDDAHLHESGAATATAAAVETEEPWRGEEPVPESSAVPVMVPGRERDVTTWAMAIAIALVLIAAFVFVVKLG